MFFSGSRENIDQALHTPLYQAERYGAQQDDQGYYPEKMGYSGGQRDPSEMHFNASSNYGDLNRGKSGSTTDTFV